MDKTTTAGSIPKEKLPRHVGMIMDGNGRWAKQRGLPRAMGHRAGMEALHDIISLCGELGIEVLSLYAFSTENWKRSAEEVGVLMDLLVEYMHREVDALHRNGVRLRYMGDLTALPPNVQKALEEGREKTAQNKGLIVNIALNYGGRSELVRALRSIVAAGVAPEKITEETVNAALYTAGLPDPDLIIRTSGEQRISNFMLWQGSYAEYSFPQCNWPDFDRAALLQVLQDYANRDRRFGARKETQP